MGVGIKNGVLISDYSWNPGHFFLFILISSYTTLNVSWGTQINLQAQDWSHFLVIPFKGISMTTAAFNWSLSSGI